jgi:autotransporter-associated beta strand protein
MDPRRPSVRFPSRIAVSSIAVAAASAVAALVAGPRPAMAVAYTFSNPNGGAINVSTNFTPVGVPGPSDELRIDALARITSGITLTVPVNQTINALTYNHYGQNSLNGPGTLTLQSGQLNFTNAITELPDAALTTLFINAPITGGSGLTKTGPGFALLNNTNTYTGGTTIGGTGGLTVVSDANLGAAGSGITLNGGTLRAAGSFTTNRPITLTGSRGRIESFGNLILNGNISGGGTQPLLLGRFTGGSLTLGGTVSSGATEIADRATVNLLGRFSSSLNDLTVFGTLNIGSASTGPAADAIADAKAIGSVGGRIVLFARATTSTETVGNYNLVTGMSTLEVVPTVNAGQHLALSGLRRSFVNGLSNRSTLFVRGRDLGGGPAGPNRALITTSSTSGLPTIGGGGTTATNHSIVPFIAGNANTTGGMSQVSVVDAGLVTLGANGLRPLSGSDYASAIGADATDNVRISDGVATQAGNATVNSLVIRNTMASSGQSGVTGTGVLTITSGAIAAVSDLAGEELFVDNPLNFNGAEAVVHALSASDGQSSLTLRGTVSSANGLTKSGHGELYLTNPSSTYGGETTIKSGTVIVSGNVISGQPSALGASSTAIIIDAGANDNVPTGLLSSTPLATISRPISAFRGLLGTFGGVGTNFSGTITLNGGFLSLLGDADSTDVLTLSGNVVPHAFLPGPVGGLQELPTAAPAYQIIRLTGNNSYGEGTIIRAGEWQAGSDTAFGTGTVFFAGNNTSSPTGGISAHGGPRSLANPLVLRAAPVFTGSNELTFTGAVDLGSVNRDVHVTNTADTAFSGIVGRGGIIKRGGGRLILANANTYNGQTVIADGALRATNNSALGVAVGTVNPAQGTFIVGTGVLELGNSITTGEAIYFGSGASPIASSSATGNLRSVSGNNTITESISFDSVGTVGVDAGSTLTLAGDTFDNTSTGTAALRKVGFGLLNVRNVRLSALDVQGGIVRVTPAGAPIGTSRVGSLSVASGAQLDLTNNSLILDYTTSSPQTAIRSLLATGQIDTSAGGARGAVGYAEATAYFPAGSSFPQNFEGQLIDGTTLLLIYTILGDASLDRIVNFDDLLTLARNYNGTGKVWTQGDFDYDGDVDFDDLLNLARSYNQTAPASTMAHLDASFAADWALAQSVVPEPTTLAALALFAPLARRRR